MIVIVGWIERKGGMPNTVGDEDFFPLTRKMIELRQTGAVEVKL